jgi:hypothetical protein
MSNGEVDGFFQVVLICIMVDSGNVSVVPWL